MKTKLKETENAEKQLKCSLIETLAELCLLMKVDDLLVVTDYILGITA